MWFNLITNSNMYGEGIIEITYKEHLAHFWNILKQQ